MMKNAESVQVPTSEDMRRSFFKAPLGDKKRNILGDFLGVNKSSFFEHF